MFGRKKAGKTQRLWKEAPDPGNISIAPDAIPDAALAATVLRRVLVEVGGDEVADFALTVQVRADPLTFVVDARWEGAIAVLGDGDAEAAVVLEDAAITLNQWNSQHTVPRLYAEIEGTESADSADSTDGGESSAQIRVCANSELSCGAGVTVQQLDEWMRRALAGVTAAGEFLDARWPDALDEVPEDAEGPEDDRAANTAEESPIADGDITALIVEGNRYGLLGGRTPALILPRLGDGTEVREAGASGRRGNGYLRFAAGPDVALHDGVMSISDSLVLGEVSSDLSGWLHILCDRMNAQPGGVVSVVDNSPSGTALTCALHRPVGSGLSDAQVEDAVTRGRAAVALCTRLLLAEVTGDSEGSDA